MEEEIHGEWQKVSARNRPFDDVCKIEDKHHSSDDSDETDGENDVDKAVLLETKIEIMDADKAKEKAKQSGVPDFT